MAWSSARGAEAQPAATDADKRAVAKRYVDAGLAAEAVKDYKAAVDLYLRAYDLVPHPLLIYNMGEAYRLGGQHAEALAHFKRYLAADPRGVRAADAASKIGPLEKAVKQEEARKADEARKAEEARRAQEARLAELARLAEEARAAEAAQAAEVERARAAEEQQRVEAARLVQAAALRRRADRWRLAGIGTTVAGASALAVGGYFGYRARSLSNEVSEQYDSTKAAEGERLERLQVIALVGGGVVTATGVALIVVGWRKGRHVPPIAVTPTSDRAGAVVSFTGGW